MLILIADPTDIDGISQLTAIINRVSCSKAPDCSTLNRYACVSVSNTCGKCKDGFYGDNDDSNTNCISSSLLLLSSSSSIQSKTCTNNCNDNGKCIFINTNTNIIVDECSIIDPTCHAECKCNQGNTNINTNTNPNTNKNTNTNNNRVCIRNM